MEIPTREQYEAEISRLQSNIIKAQEWKEKEHRRLIISPYAKYITTQTKYGNPMCKGGGSACWDHINRDKKLYEEMSGRLSDDISNAKQALWDYQKDVAKAEQDAQVEAVRQAIADQVRLEQERIQQSQQNQIIMQEAPPAEPEPSATAIMEPGNNLTEANILPGDFKLPFHENYLIPIIAIGGYLVLRN